MHATLLEHVKKNTVSGIARVVRAEIVERLHHFSNHRDEIDQRLRVLDAEWDTERALETLAPSFILLGLGLGHIGNRKWWVFSASIAGFLLQHAVSGGSPAMPLLRSLGFRTVREIDEERYALKILRGDFDAPVRDSESATRGEDIYGAVRPET